MELYTRQDITDATHLPSEAEAERASKALARQTACVTAPDRAMLNLDVAILV